MSRGEALTETHDESRLAGWGRSARLLAPFACLYLTFGATFSLLGTGAPLVFRAHGMPLGQIGWLQLIYLPIGITFLWAPLIDRVKLPGLPHRIGWIALSQVATVGLLLVLSRGTDWPIPTLFVLVLATSVAVATMDVALEALVVDTVPRARRPAVTTAKLIGSSVGSTLAIELVTAFPTTIDLSRAALVVALVDAAMLLPLLLYPETERRLGPVAEDRPSSGRPTSPRQTRARLRRVGGHGLVIGLYFAPAIMLGSTPSLALLDLGVSLPTVGLITGPVTTAINTAMMLLSGFLLTRLAGHRLVLGLALGVAAAGLIFAGAAFAHVAILGLVASLLIILFDAGLGVPVFNVMYRWAEGAHAATDYAILFCIAFLVSFPLRVVSPMIAAALGWPLFFALAVPPYLVAVILLTRAMKATAPARS